ncbi:hypothetical protein, partial [Mycolicibacterium peregrinum]|uniref:hypothetical protein n=1 Tax=Mycolicibacterium peregrinum TaxID=43304 RepID=UPI000A3EC252
HLYQGYSAGLGNGVVAVSVVARADSAARTGGSSGRDGSPATARCREGAVPDGASAGREVRPIR